MRCTLHSCRLPEQQMKQRVKVRMIPGIPCSVWNILSAQTLSVLQLPQQDKFPVLQPGI
jgi:hypothetical protein